MYVCKDSAAPAHARTRAHSTQARGVYNKGFFVFLYTPSPSLIIHIIIIIIHTSTSVKKEGGHEHTHTRIGNISESRGSGGSLINKGGELP